ncbi:hypothetical protein TrRE_jg5325 [Triparma retinervis]|uniref:Uncharacterized protein n=1 Tax=Triparma retinervis TaxID=2557542 RepID=A0A9W7A1Y0_9STRA|nr:hypothetical protein TrRE_jg5325 [Triparma retinervis]
MLYDELWELWKNYPMENSRLLPTFDILAFYVDPRLGQSGFSPHRDRQPLDVSASFFPDGLPKYVTRWIAVEDADAESNSCLYVIPKQHDPGYMAGDDEEEGGGEEGGGGEVEDKNNKIASTAQQNIDGGVNPSVLPLQRALSTKESYQYIRALPIPAGSSLVFSHRVIHWGSSGNPKTTIKPRIAISFTYSDPSFEKPYLKSSAFEWSGSPPPFPIRLLLCCCQMLIYYQRFGLDRGGVMSCYEYVKEHGGSYLEEGYMRKVLREFVGAVKEGGEGGDNDSEINDSDEERMLEEMLEQADEFEDDYDHEEGDDEEGGEEGDLDEEDDFEDEFDDNELGEGPLDGSFPKRKRRKTLDDDDDA